MERLFVAFFSNFLKRLKERSKVTIPFDVRHCLELLSHLFWILSKQTTTEISAFGQVNDPSIPCRRLSCHHVSFRS